MCKLFQSEGTIIEKTIPQISNPNLIARPSGPLYSMLATTSLSSVQSKL